MPDMNTVQAEGNSDDAAIALRLKFVGQELIMAEGAIARAKEQLEPILAVGKAKRELAGIKRMVALVESA